MVCDGGPLRMVILFCYVVLVSLLSSSIIGSYSGGCLECYISVLCCYFSLVGRIGTGCTVYFLLLVSVLFVAGLLMYQL